MRRLVIVCVGLAMAGAAQGQVIQRFAPRLGPSSPGALRVDPVALLQSRLLRLEHRVNALQSTIDKTQPTLTFQCTDTAVSRNSVGVVEDCTPYACAPIDGRCRVTAKTSNDCAVGFSWVEGGGCVSNNSGG